MSFIGRQGARRLAGLLLLLAAVAALYLSRAALLPPVARFLDVSEAARRVDYVLVLGGGRETRPFVATALVRSGYAGKVLVPAVKSDPEVEAGIMLPEQEVIRRVLLARGVPAESIILLSGEVSSTQDEAQALAEFLQTQPESTVAVVTNGFHTRRARGIFQRALGERASRVHFVAAPLDGCDESNWWRTEEGFQCYLSEYAKLGYYWLH
jgi:uncharacterized SAM-binding protein YcdF (DUF218 family)